MYALELVDCQSFNHANALRIMLEADGYAAIAMEAMEGPHTLFLVICAAPAGYAEQLYPIAAAFAAVPGGMDEVVSAATEHANDSYRPEMVIPQRDEVRKALRAAADYAVDRIVEVLPADELVPTVNHDPGDEDTKPSRAIRDVCPWDNWKPDRNIH